MAKDVNGECWLGNGVLGWVAASVAQKVQAGSQHPRMQRQWRRVFTLASTSSGTETVGRCGYMMGVGEWAGVHKSPDVAVTGGGHLLPTLEVRPTKPMSSGRAHEQAGD